MCISRIRVDMYTLDAYCHTHIISNNFYYYVVPFLCSRTYYEFNTTYETNPLRHNMWVYVYVLTMYKINYVSCWYAL